MEAANHLGVFDQAVRLQLIFLPHGSARECFTGNAMTKEGTMRKHRSCLRKAYPGTDGQSSASSGKIRPLKDRYQCLSEEETGRIDASGKLFLLKRECE